MRFLVPLFVFCATLNVFAGEVPKGFLHYDPIKGVKQRTVREYAKDSEEKDSLLRTLTFEYDENGYVTKIAEDSGYMQRETTFTYERADDGRLLSCCEFSERGNVDDTTEFLYKGNNLVEVRVWSKRGGPDERLWSAYKCNDSGYPAEESVYDKDNRVLGKRTFEYDEAGRLVKTSLSATGSTSIEFIYRYNAAGVLVSEDELICGELSEKTVYNEHGDVVSVDRYGAFSIDPQSGETKRMRVAQLYSYEYDPAGRKKSKVLEEVEGDHKKFVRKVTYEYELWKDEKK